MGCRRGDTHHGANGGQVRTGESRNVQRRRGCTLFPSFLAVRRFSKWRLCCWGCGWDLLFGPTFANSFALTKTQRDTLPGGPRQPNPGSIESPLAKFGLVIVQPPHPLRTVVRILQQRPDPLQFGSCHPTSSLWGPAHGDDPINHRTGHIPEASKFSQWCHFCLGSIGPRRPSGDEARKQSRPHKRSPSSAAMESAAKKNLKLKPPWVSPLGVGFLMPADQWPFFHGHFRDQGTFRRQGMRYTTAHSQTTHQPRGGVRNTPTPICPEHPPVGGRV